MALRDAADRAADGVGERGLSERRVAWNDLPGDTLGMALVV